MDSSRRRPEQQDPVGFSGLTAEEAAAKLGDTVRAAPQRLQVYQQTLQFVVRGSTQIILWLAVLLVLFILHQVNLKLKLHTHTHTP